MARMSFADILKSARISISREYKRLSDSFYEEFDDYCLYDSVYEAFMSFKFRDTCISLDDFNETFGFAFPASIEDDDIDTLVLLCEYMINLLLHCKLPNDEANSAFKFCHNIEKVMDKIGYKRSQDENGLLIFVPNSIEVFETAKIVPPALSYKTIEYNHHSNKGNLSAKLGILKTMADDIEPQRKELRIANGTLESVHTN